MAGPAIRYVSESEAGEKLGVPAQTLRYWRHVSKGPKYIKLPNRRIVYREDDLDGWMGALVVEPLDAA